MNTKDLKDGVDIEEAISIMLTLNMLVSEVAGAVQDARVQRRQKITPEVWRDIVAASDAARQELVDAIKSAS
jgi:hypothetical protein